MPLVKQTLETSIKLIIDELITQTDNPDAARTKFAQRLATCIDAYIKTATVTVTVTTAGTAASQAGTGTGKLT